MSRFEEAVKFATEVYAGKQRKGSINPFVLHPLETAAVAAGLTVDEDILIAALLHDAIEDAGCSPDLIEKKFGRRVLLLVLGDTEPESDDWMTRKVAMIDYLKNSASKEEKIIVLSDRLSNLRSIYNDLREMGKDMWAVFHVQSDPDVQQWYYREVIDNMTEFRGTTAYEELCELERKVFGV